MVKRECISLVNRVLIVLLFCLACFSFAAEESSTSESQEETPLWLEICSWPFVHVIQPTFNVLIYPVAKPVDYAFQNGIIEKTVELVTFGKENNILIYPGFNFMPGASTMVGLNYRHRGILFDRDYLVLQPNYYANGDLNMSVRYNKHGLFGTPLFGGFRFDLDWDRDAHFVVPESKHSYLQPDSAFAFTWRLGAPLTSTANWNVELSTTLHFNHASSPDVEDSVLISDLYPIEDRGLYQDMVQVPVSLSLFYDNLDYPYAPSRGNRVGLSASYIWVGEYGGVKYSDLGIDPKTMDKPELRDGGKEHDFFKTEFLFQHYFFLGTRSEEYILSVKEGRQSRKFYTDFSWEEAVRIWRPEQVMTTLFERRVIALQYRFVNLWEMEEGGAPYTAFTIVNARTPLRGYGDAWSTHHLMALSVEYRWPVDRFVDGVVFDEYALLAPKIDKWSLDHYYNSWGFGIRVRQPNMYLFRVQLGFHGLHGINMIITIAPEFR